EHKAKIIEPIAKLIAAGWNIHTTSGTHRYLAERGLTTHLIHKLSENRQPTVQTAIADHQIDLMLNVPSWTADDRDAYDIRRLAIDNHIPLVTNAEIAVIVLRCLGEVDLRNIQLKS